MSVTGTTFAVNAGTKGSRVSVIEGEVHLDRNGSDKVLRAGDHVLVSDSAYLPTRKLCDTILTRYGIATTYYEPTIGSGIAALLQANTRAVFVESPGSLTFEIQDIPAIGALCREKGIVFHVDAAQATGKIEIDLKKLVQAGRAVVIVGVLQVIVCAAMALVAMRLLGFAGLPAL